MKIFRALPIALFAMLAAAPCCASAQTNPSVAQKERDARHARAVARCKAQRGVDCDTAKGLHEWELVERSRAQAMREGSRRGSPEPVEAKK